TSIVGFSLISSGLTGAGGSWTAAVPIVGVVVSWTAAAAAGGAGVSWLASAGGSGVARAAAPAAGGQGASLTAVVAADAGVCWIAVVADGVVALGESVSAAVNTAVTTEANSTKQPIITLSMRLPPRD